MRSLPREEIPVQLWTDNTLFMPNCLSSCYRELLSQYNVMHYAEDLTNRTSAIGGPSLNETLEHFGRRFGVSSFRIEGTILDPENAFQPISDNLINLFTEGKVALLDIACGTGGVGASILSTLFTLRKEQILPKIPLEINIIGGDCSASALEIYEKFINYLSPHLKSVGIESNLFTTEWRAEASYTTSQLFDQLFEQNPNADEYLVIVANFSGALDTHFAEYENSVHHIFDRTHNKKCAIIWIEPSQFSNANNLFIRLKQLLDATPWRRVSQGEPTSHVYQYYHPIQGKIYPCRILIKAYDRRH